jgi:hypothetical protein
MLCSASALCLTFLPTAATGAERVDQERAKRVLMLFSASKELPANIFLERAKRAELEKRSRARLEFYAEHLDASRFPGESHYRLFRGVPVATRSFSLISVCLASVSQ